LAAAVPGRIASLRPNSAFVLFGRASDVTTCRPLPPVVLQKDARPSSDNRSRISLAASMTRPKTNVRRRIDCGGRLSASTAWSTFSTRSSGPRKRASPRTYRTAGPKSLPDFGGPCRRQTIPSLERETRSIWVCLFLARCRHGSNKLPFGIISAPGYRYHPAVIAQGAATHQ
jgi:hypothetical protein